MAFGQLLKSKRNQRGWTQEELSDRLKISRPTISSWEGDKTLPDISNLLKMSLLFGCTLDELLREEIKLTTKTFKTMTYNNVTTPLRVKNAGEHKKISFKNQNPEVKANVNLDTGEVTFFIEQDLSLIHI